MKQNKQSDETQIALMGKDISQIQKDVSAINAKIEVISNSRYVTQNDMQMAIKEVKDDFSKDVATMNERLAGIQKILWLIFSTFAIAVITALARVVLKF